jgi:hypothetical protein
LEQSKSLHTSTPVEVESSADIIGAFPVPPLMLLSKDVVVDIAKVAIPPLFSFLAGWLARSGRKVRLKFADIEVEAETEEQLKRLLQLTENLRREQTGQIEVNRRVVEPPDKS